MRNLPNYITVGRLLSLPVLVAMMLINTPWAAWTALGIYTAGCLTDWLDGYIARRFKFESAFGKFLDPVADKIFIATVLITLLANGNLPWWGSIPVILILCREFLVSGLREFFGPQNIQFPVSNLAKWKTTAQMFSLGFLIMGEHGETVFPPNWEIGYSLLLIATILTMMTGWIYLKEGIKHLDA
ncbi:MAG: CDP-diacylglycerol--glycerol-3-phosphate 3-phosphatidyltransferase [Alphaproteobacteria bacterium]|jgi:cardiolipin synthase|nr:CDP-diacylglycerol--glycerol-3-phosphate 3-phosphatidyltransferase [Alphaproteobacteria bacterium]MCB1550814.1 CDP-diacylglycerol--glycerol-3-phosphate 3-phosphatidyltransferase [Alphaproteobacteria bacterium]MCB9985110.1 CDP-diacylglycerol--glycerol-3-phosphate 3-phosphatidyltransferase [Micavibrio sp.]HRK97491.1 CDP-diacylglycerol--glycerol-3-phosphate 3-phosphatidyltransferase [Alphaproteobacteria bacterium]